MTKLVELEDYELSPNLRKICGAVLLAFALVVGLSLFGVHVPSAIKTFLEILLLPAGLLLNASRLSIWVKK